MTPPYEITPAILHLVAEISEKIGAIRAAHLIEPSPELRKANRVKTIQGSLGIEGNTLSVEQITAILEDKRVIGPVKDVQEVKNAIETYQLIGKFKAGNSKDFLKAHGILMKNLVDSAGKFRSKAVGIVKGEQVAHLAPPGDRVPGLMRDLFDWLKKSPEHPLIKSCVFHYETEFIHPFMDGNGRIGRLWQAVILMEKYPVFEFLPVETIIKERQQEYYDVLATSDKVGASTSFIAFMLEVLLQALDELYLSSNVSLTWNKRMEFFRSATSQPFSRKDYLAYFKNISTATASRDLKTAVEAGILKTSGQGNRMKYQFH